MTHPLITAVETAKSKAASTRAAADAMIESIGSAEATCTDAEARAAAAQATVDAFLADRAEGKAVAALPAARAALASAAQDTDDAQRGLAVLRKRQTAVEYAERAAERDLGYRMADVARAVDLKLCEDARAKAVALADALRTRHEHALGANVVREISTFHGADPVPVNSSFHVNLQTSPSDGGITGILASGGFHCRDVQLIPSAVGRASFDDIIATARELL